MTLPPIPNDPSARNQQTGQPFAYPVGAVVNGFRWDGIAWQPVALAAPKRSNYALWITLGTVGGIVVLCLAGFIAVIASSGGTKAPTASTSTSSPETTSAPRTEAAEAPTGPPTVKPGTQVPITTSLDKNLKVTVKNMKTGVRSSNQFDDDTGERGYITVDVEIMFVDGDETYLAEPSDFKLIAADGLVYESEWLVVGISGDLETVTLNPGQKTTGKVVFDAPKATAKGAKIQYVDFGKAAAYWLYP